MNDDQPCPVLCDLDGVVWLDHRAIPGSVDAIKRLRTAGHRVLFVTNNSAALVADHEGALADIGIDAVGDVVTSSGAAATLVGAGERVLIAGGPGVGEAVAARGALPIEVDESCLDDPIDAVVVGLRRDIDYRWLTLVSNAVRSGARYIATNDDATYPTPRGLEPGGGTIVAAVSTASGVAPVVAGKPNRPMVNVVAERLGRMPTDSTVASQIESVDSAAVGRPSSVAEFAMSDRAVAVPVMPDVVPDVVMVGDRASTDGAFAGVLGARFALVRSGVTGADEAVPGTSFDGDNLAAVADWLLDR